MFFFQVVRFIQTVISTQFTSLLGRKGSLSLEAFGVFAAVVLSGVLSGCGGSVDRPIPSDAQIPPSGLDQARRLARDAEVSCVDGGECFGSVGLVVSTQETGVNTCTGFLVQGDSVVTAQQCLPRDLRQAGGSCTGRISVHFPSLSRGSLRSGETSPSAHVECEKVEFISKNELNYAVLKLAQPVARKPFVLRFDGVQEGTLLSVPAFVPSSDKRPVGELRVSSCKAVQRSVVLPEFDDPLHPRVAIAECDLGNSSYGAPVLDPAGNVVAVLSSRFTQIENLQKRLSQYLDRVQVTSFSFASNVACMGELGRRVDPEFTVSQRCLIYSLSGRSSDVPEDRPLRDQPITAQIADSERERAVQALALEIKDWESSLEKNYLRWRTPRVMLNSSSSVRPEPECFLPLSGWISQYETKFLFFHISYDSSVRWDLEVPRYQIAYGLNSYAQPDYSVNELERVPLSVTFSPRMLNGSGRSPVEVSIRGKKRNEVLQRFENIPLCLE